MKNYIRFSILLELETEDGSLDPSVWAKYQELITKAIEDAKNDSITHVEVKAK